MNHFKSSLQSHGAKPKTLRTLFSMQWARAGEKGMLPMKTCPALTVVSHTLEKAPSTLPNKIWDNGEQHLLGGDCWMLSALTPSLLWLPSTSLKYFEGNKQECGSCFWVLVVAYVVSAAASVGSSSAQWPIWGPLNTAISSLVELCDTGAVLKIICTLFFSLQTGLLYKPDDRSQAWSWHCHNVLLGKLLGDLQWKQEVKSHSRIQ